MEVPITAQVVKSIMDSLIIPKFKAFREEMKYKYDSKVIPTEKHFEGYFERQYEQLSIMNTIARRNQQLPLLSVYQPLTISVDSTKRESAKIEKIPYMLIEKYRKILITDNAGMGKSTMSKYMFLKMVEEHLCIPLFIELRKLSKKNTLIDEIISLLNGIEDKIDRDLLIALLKKGNFYFILDGFDEIAISNRDIVVEDIKNFINNLSEKNYFILTSRPESMLSTFGDFKSFQILPLKEIEAYSLLSKYDENGDTSTKLINELKSDRNETIKEFLKNPLLVSLLFVVYDYRATIPLKKHLFYSQIYDALFEDHDLSKGAQNIHIKRCGLDKDDFEKILRFIGFQSFQTNTIQYTSDQLIDLISKSNAYWKSLDVKPSDVLKDLVIAVPLFVKDGLEYKWAHKSLSEYFAAKFIFQDAKENQSKMLSLLYASENLPRYINLLDLYYDLDIIGFKKNILLPLLELYKEYLSGLKEESMSYFLRNLCFLRDIRIKVSWVKSSKNGSMKIKLDGEPFSRYMSIQQGASDVIIFLGEIASKNNNGKRMLLLKIGEKKIHKIKTFQTARSRFLWIESLEKDKWMDLDDVISQAGEVSDRLGEVCELVTHFDRMDKVYMDKEDIENEIQAIRSELEGQSLDFIFSL